MISMLTEIVQHDFRMQSWICGKRRKCIFIEFYQKSISWKIGQGKFSAFLHLQNCRLFFNSWCGILNFIILQKRRFFFNFNEGEWNQNFYMLFYEILWISRFYKTKKDLRFLWTFCEFFLLFGFLWNFMHFLCFITDPLILILKKYVAWCKVCINIIAQ